MADFPARGGGPPVGPSLAKAKAQAQVAVEARVGRAWRAWLASLATDADAAMAAALLYAELPAAARDAWLDALEQDAPEVSAPREALYGPLLAVETDPQRSARIRQQGQLNLQPLSSVERALLGTAAEGSCVVALVIPLYLDFVRVLLCRFVRRERIEWVEQWPIVLGPSAPRAGDCVEGIELRTAAPSVAVDELAHAVVAQGRAGEPLPEELVGCADLFSPQIGMASVGSF